jgi:hypothetical protein
MPELLSLGFGVVPEGQCCLIPQHMIAWRQNTTFSVLRSDELQTKDALVLDSRVRGKLRLVGWLAALQSAEVLDHTVLQPR